MFFDRLAANRAMRSSSMAAILPHVRTGEIVGGGSAGLAAACALAQRGWRVRVHERADRLRTAGAGINVYENGLRVLEALGALEETIRDGARAKLRETRDQDDRLLSVHHWNVRVHGVLRQRMIDALSSAARRAGAEIITGSEAVSATPEGDVQLANGERLRGDLIVAADGVNSRLRDVLGLVDVRRYLRDGCIRLLIPARNAEEGLDTRTIEYWSGHRRLLYNPCNREQLYFALSMPHDDVAGRTLPVNKALWAQSFPHQRELIERIGDDGRYDRFEYITLKRWSAGRVAVIGDAAHALPPNIGQGAGCAMMNALSLAVFLEQGSDVAAQLQAWERAERPLTDHSQRISRLYGMPTFWPAPLRRLFYAAAGRSRWLTEQRTRTARHIPTGT